MIKQNYIQISDDEPGYPIDLLSIPLHYRDDIESVLIPHGLILDRTEALANQIFEELGNAPLVCLCVLKSGFKFCADLTDRIQIKNRTNPNKSMPIMIDFIKYKRVNGINHSFDYQLMDSDNFEKIKGKNVLIVDNILETGKKILKIINTLEEYKPCKIKTCSLLVKRVSNSYESYIPNYVGFQIPNKFVVGYALDLNETFRDLEHVCLIKEYNENNNINSIETFK